MVSISERVSCIHVWRTPFSVIPIHGTVHHKNENWTDGNSLSRKIQMCYCVKCTRVSGNLSLMLSNFCIFEPRPDKINKVAVRPAKTQISLGIRPVWLEASLSAWRNLGPLTTHWAHNEDSDQTGRMPRLIWVIAGRTLSLLVLSCRGSFVCLAPSACDICMMRYKNKNNALIYDLKWRKFVEKKRKKMCSY